jgi:hypothetical protein
MRSILGQAPGVDERAIDLGYPSDVGEDGGRPAAGIGRRTPSLTRPQTPGPAATPPAPGPAQIVSLSCPSPTLQAADGQGPD